ncbi:hypothetical protein [Amycolatopsis coloradensis]|nr:hypothetical protein [Amycolatopsis coloradensis]
MDGRVGVAATLLDSAVACALHSTLPAGVVKAGSRVAFAEDDIRDAQVKP